MARQRLTQVARPATSQARDWAAVGVVGFCEILGVPLTIEQRVLCRVAFERVEPRDLSPPEYAIAQKLLKPAEQLEPVDTIPKHARSVFTLVKGRRTGGTYLSALYSSHRALAADLSTLAPGEVGRVIFGAPDLDQATMALTYAVGAFESHPELEPLIREKSAHRLVIERPNDGRKVEFVTRAASRGGRTFRSRSVLCACLTEVSQFLTSDYIVNDEECFRALTPSILPGGVCILESSPLAEAGLLYTEFERNWGHPSTSIAMHAPTLLLLNSERNREVVALQEATDPEVAQREFGAQFIPFGSNLFFPGEVIRRSKVAGGGTTKAPGPGELGSVGGDLGLTRDAAAFVVVHRKPDPDQGEQRDPKLDRYRVVECVERRPQRGAPLKLRELVPLAAELAGRHGQKSALVDQWSLQAAREHAPPGFSLDADATTDEAAQYDAVLELMKAGRVEIPEEFAALLRQLPLVMSKPTPGGGKKIILPRKFGSHCDLVPAFVKAVWKAKRAHIGVTTSQPKDVRQRQGARTGGF